MSIFRPQRVPKKEISSEDLLALFCLYFPQYKFHEARKMPYKRVIQMLKVARKEEAKRFLELTQIVAAPHTKRGKGVKQLLDHYKKSIG